MSSYIPQNLECVWLHKPYIHIYVNILFSQLKFAYILWSNNENKKYEIK